MNTDEAFNAALDRLAAQMNEPEVKKWLEIRKEAGRKLDPETADVTCDWVQVVDPYGVSAQFPEELDCVGKQFFARAKGTDIWISFDHLPSAAIERLRQKIEAGDFEKPSAHQDSKHFEGLTAEEALEILQLAKTNNSEIEDLIFFPDRGWQIVIRENHGGTIANPQ